MARNKPEDPFDDDWNPLGDTANQEMPESSERAPFLKPFHLKTNEGTLELVSAGSGTEYSDVVLHIQINRTMFRLGLRTFDPGYVALRKKFGPKREDWHGTIRYRIMPHKGNPQGYVSVRP